jgi:hypothetical protein
MPRFLLGISIFEGITARRLYKSFGVEGMKTKTAGRPPFRHTVRDESLVFGASIMQTQQWCSANAW